MTIIKALVMRCSASRTGRRLLSGGIWVYDRFLCSPAAVTRQIKQRMGGQKKQEFQFSVGIAHYNRGGTISRPLRNLLNHPSVGEIVIVDDGSSEEEFALLKRGLENMGASSRVKLFRREENLGAMLTKLECVERCSLDWVLVLDSDNTVFRSYLDALSSQQELHEDTIYCASWAFPCFSFHGLGRRVIDFEAASDLTRSGALRRVYIINDGNYLVPRKEYVDRVTEIGSIKSHAADVMLVNYRWLSAGNKLEMIPSTSYLHRVEESSFWENTREKSRSRVLDLFSRFEAGLRWNEAYKASLLNGL